MNKKKITIIATIASCLVSVVLASDIGQSNAAGSTTEKVKAFTFFDLDPNQPIYYEVTNNNNYEISLLFGSGHKIKRSGDVEVWGNTSEDEGTHVSLSAKGSDVFGWNKRTKSEGVPAGTELTTFLGDYLIEMPYFYNGRQYSATSNFKILEPLTVEILKDGATPATFISGETYTLRVTAPAGSRGGALYDKNGWVITDSSGKIVYRPGSLKTPVLLPINPGHDFTATFKMENNIDSRTPQPLAPGKYRLELRYNANLFREFNIISR